MKKLRLDRKTNVDGKVKVRTKYLPVLNDDVTDENIRGLKETLTFIVEEKSLVKIEETVY